MQFWHMSGAGNDFAVLDGRGLTLDYPALSRQLCSRLGADGLMAVDTAEDGSLKLHFYNSDGSRGEMCGNGSRCLCRFVYDNGIAGAQMALHTDAGTIYATRLSQERYRVRLNPPGLVDLTRRPDAAYVELGDPGIPHAVAALSGLEFDHKEKLYEKALELRHDPVFPKGVNVNFYTELSPGRVRVLTYERFVEDYTLACGTGCTSIAVALWLQGKLPGGVLQAENEGGVLTVTLTETDGILQPALEGPAQVLGIYEI